MFNRTNHNTNFNNNLMAVSDIDFEGQGGQGQGSAPASNPPAGTGAGTNQEDVTNLNGGETEDVTGKDGNQPANNANDITNTDDTTSSTGELNPGDSLDVDGTTYTVAENGDIVDKDGNVFKEAKDVSEWLKSVDVEDDNEDSNLTVSSIQEALGVTITDENGKPVEFTNDAAGIKSYVDSVISLKSKELQEAAVNRLYQDNPLLKQFQDYVQLTGTPRGFGEIPDRSGIELDKDNEQQLVAVIRMAAQEFGNKSLNDNYIKYLRDSGGLYDEARVQLENLVKKDTDYRKQIETRAREQREAEAKATEDYWNNVRKVVDGRNIGGYRIPESFTKEINGKKTVITPKDFYDFLSRPIQTEDGQRMTGYQHALSKLSDEQYLNREILDAWLMFTGGTYKDLIDMAVKEEEVRKLRIKSKEQRSTKTVKVIKNPANKSSIDDIVL